MLQRYRTAFLLFIAAALLLAVPIVFSNSFNWWQRDLLFAVPIVLAIWAQILYFNVRLNMLDRKWQLKLPHIAMPTVQVPEYMQDDLQDIKEGRITGTQFALLTTIAGIFIFLFYLLAYHKLTAQWHGFNVMLVSMFASACVAFLIGRTEWFSDQTFRTPLQVFLIPVIALVVCVGIGIYMTEPLEFGGPSAYQAGQKQAQVYNYDNTRAHSTVMYWGGSTTSSRSSSTGSSSGFKCTGKGCGYAALLIILIIVVLVLIICSALVAHFWVLAGMLLLTIMLMIAIHELRVMDTWRYRSNRSW